MKPTRGAGLLYAVVAVLGVATPFVLTEYDPFGVRSPVAKASEDRRIRTATGLELAAVSSRNKVRLAKIEDAQNAPVDVLEAIQDEGEEEAPLVVGNAKDGGVPEALRGLEITESLFSRWIKTPSSGPRYYGSCGGVLCFDDGSPVIGEQIWLWGDPHVTALTDTSGRFELLQDWIDPGGRGLMIGSRSGALELENVALIPDQMVEISSRVSRGFAIEIRVVDASTRTPVADAFVQLSVPASRLGTSNPLVMKGWSGGDGVLRFRHVVSEYYSIFVVAEGFRTNMTRLNLTAGKPTEAARIELDRAGRLFVKIAGWPDGQERAARLWLRSTDTRSQRIKDGRVNQTGVFVAQSPLAGEYMGWFETESWRLDLPDVEIPELGDVLVELDRPEGISVTGTVLDAAGNPVEGEIRLRAGAGVSPVAREGRFCLHPVEPGERVFSLIVGHQRILEVVRIDVGEDGVKDLDLRLPAGVVSGIIEGLPLPVHQTVIIQKREKSRWWKSYGTVDLFPDGSFEARYLEPGRYLLQLGVMEGGFVADQEFELTRDRMQCEVEGQWVQNPEIEIHLTTDDGTVLPDIVFISPRGAHGFQLPIDVNGRGKTRDLPVGKWSVHVVASTKRARVDVEIKPEGNDVIEIVLAEQK